MPIYSRRQIAEHFRALLQQHPRQHAVQMTASRFGHSAETIEAVAKDAAVTAFLHAVGLDGADMFWAKKIADDYAMSVQALQRAVEEHCEVMEA